MKRFFASLAIGMPVTFLGLIMITGGVEEAGQLLLFSIVCTAGIGLVVWLPLWWVVGWATLALIGLFKEHPVGKEEATRESFLLNQAMVALSEYMRLAAADGISDDEIVAHLRSTGWSEAEILKARGILNSQQKT